MTLARKLWQRAIDLLPVDGFYFERPLLLLQSDDWGRVGVRDEEGLELLRAAGIPLGERPYDFYTLETAEDVAALADLLNRHRDSIGRAACLEMNFMTANLDFVRMRGDGFARIHLVPLAAGLPEGWKRPGLFDGYRAGVDQGVFHAAMHGTTHFCARAVERTLPAAGERGALLRTLWQAGTPYIYWRMPWIGYEYWDPDSPPEKRFLPAEEQNEKIGESVGAFAKFFSTPPRSACAPGYRANGDTHRAWAHFGVRTVQNGPGNPAPPHLDRNGLLHLSRTVEFEPATDPAFSLDASIHAAEACFARGIPAIVSLHSINFHSSVEDFRSRTLELLDQFLGALQARHPRLLYLHDQDLYDLVHHGCYSGPAATIALKVAKRSFTRRKIAVRKEG